MLGLLPEINLFYSTYSGQCPLGIDIIPVRVDLVFKEVVKNRKLPEQGINVE